MFFFFQWRQILKVLEQLRREFYISFSLVDLLEDCVGILITFDITGQLSSSEVVQVAQLMVTPHLQKMRRGAQVRGS